MNETLKIFSSLSDRNRLKILMMLLNRPLCVCEITSVLKLSTSTVSGHLSVLKESGFINDEKNGKWVNYSIAKSKTTPKIQQILLLLQMWLDDDEEIAAVLEEANRADRNNIC